MADDGDDDKDKIIQQQSKDLGELRGKLRTAEAALKKAEEGGPAAIEAARSEAAAEVRAELEGKHAASIAAAEVRAAAAKVLADPDDAPKFLDMTKVLDVTGKIDPEKVKTELDGLVERKPYLAVQSSGGGNGSTPPAKPAGSADGGARPAGGGDPDARMNDLIHKAAGRG